MIRVCKIFICRQLIFGESSWLIGENKGLLNVSPDDGGRIGFFQRSPFTPASWVPTDTGIIWGSLKAVIWQAGLGPLLLLFELAYLNVPIA